MLKPPYLFIKEERLLAFCAARLVERNQLTHSTLRAGNTHPRRRWRIAWLLGLGVLVNYFDRVNLSVSHDSLYIAFGISNVTFGWLSGAYNWTYAFCQLPIGVLLDKLGVRRIG